jgi:hypothetical protein
MQPSRTLRDELFHAPLPTSRADGWAFQVYGQREQRFGPYPTRTVALDVRFALFGRWRQAARARGGWAWKQTEERWVVTLPPTTEPRGLTFTAPPCSRHQ